MAKNWFLIAVCLLFISNSQKCFAYDPNALAETLYASGNQLEEAKKYDEAKVAYKQVLQQYPDSPFAAGAALHLSRFNVLSLIASGKDKAAQPEIADMTSRFAGHPDMPWYLYGIGNQYEESRRNDEAKAIYERILKQYPDSPVAPGARLHFSRCNVSSLIASGNMAAAQSEIDGIKTSFPNHPDLPWYLNAVANQYEQSEKYQEAKGIYQQTTTQLPDTAVVPGTQVGFTDYAKLQAARIDIFKLIDNDNLDAADASIAKLKTDFAAHPMLSEAMFQIAEECYKKGITVLHQEPDPNNPFFKKSVAILENDIVNIRKNLVYYLLGLSCWKLGDYDKAIQVYTDFYLYDPNQLDMCLFAIALCHEKKADGEAVEAYKTVIDNCPDSPFAFQAKVKLSERGVK